MAIDINRKYMDSFTEDEREAKHKARVELEKQMAEFLAKGGKVEKVKAHKPTKEQLKNWTI